MTDNTLHIGQLRRADGIERPGNPVVILRIGRHSAGMPNHRTLKDAATGKPYGVLLSDECLLSLPIVDPTDPR